MEIVYSLQSHVPKAEDSIVVMQLRLLVFIKLIVSFLAVFTGQAHGNLVIHDSEKNSCPRYAMLQFKHAGFGHLMSQVILTYVYALEKKATPVLPKHEILNKINPHGNYSWANELFDFSAFLDESDVTKLPVKIVTEKMWHIDSFSQCNVLYVTCDTCCPFLRREKLFDEMDWCYTKKPTAYQIARPLFRQLFREVPTSTVPQLMEARRQGKIDVVFHLRVGDITLSTNSKRSVVDSIMEQLQRLFPTAGLAVFLVFEASQGAHPDIANFDHIGPVHLKHLSAKQAFQHMVAASVLVTSGSSFASIATIAKPTHTLSLQFPSKDGNYGVYEVFDHAFIMPDGRISYPDWPELQTRCELIANYALPANYSAAAPRFNNHRNSTSLPKPLISANASYH